VIRCRFARHHVRSGRLQSSRSSPTTGHSFARHFDHPGPGARAARLTIEFAQKEAPVRTRRHARNRRAAEAGIRRAVRALLRWRSGTRINGLTVSQPNDYGTRASRALSAKFCSVRLQTRFGPVLGSVSPTSSSARSMALALALADRSACLAGTRFLRRSHQCPAAHRRATAAAAQSIAPG
jgi:hypothetical protein